MSSKKTAPRLGRGLAALMESSPIKRDSADTTSSAGEAQEATGQQSPNRSPVANDADIILHLPLDSIIPNPYQPRQKIDQDHLRELAASIATHGILQPITVRATDEPNKYELIAGERRWRAAELAGLDTVPAKITNLDNQASAELALIENVQRTDLDPIERADALLRLRDEFRLNVVELAKRIGQPRSTIANLIRLKELEIEVSRLLKNGSITLGHAKVLLSVPAGASRIQLAQATVKAGWSVRQLEIAARDIVANNSIKQRAQDPTAKPINLNHRARAEHLNRLADILSKQLGMRITLSQSSRSAAGTMTIHFADHEQFESLLQRLQVSIAEQD